MSPTDVKPIRRNWINNEHHSPAPAPATARELAAAIGCLDLDDLRTHHLALTLAVAELSAGAGMPWPWAVDDPTVTLVRAVAKLSLVAPDVTAGAAGAIVEQLQGG